MESWAGGLNCKDSKLKAGLMKENIFIKGGAGKTPPKDIEADKNGQLDKDLKPNLTIL